MHVVQVVLPDVHQHEEESIVSGSYRFEHAFVVPWYCEVMDSQGFKSQKMMTRRGGAGVIVP